MMKRMTAAAVTAVMLFAAANLTVSAAESGSCGENAVWTLENEVLTVSGAGAVYDYMYLDHAPWYGMEVKEAVIEEGITAVGAYAFADQAGLEKVTLSATVEKIDIGAFQNIGESFKEVVIPPSVTTIGQYAFASNGALTIKGYPGSYAEEYAENQSIPFESLGEVPLNDVVVSNTDELKAAIKSYNRVILKDGIYTIDGPLYIGSDAESITNITITAENPGRAEILSTVGYEPVVELENASQVKLEGLILGHESPEYQQGCGSSAYSSGYVVQANRSDGLTISGCDLYGCGTVAIYTEFSHDLLAENCVLRDCKESIATLDGENVKIKDCIITGNAYDPEYAKEKPAVWIPDYTAEFENCIFANNFSTVFWDGQGELIDIGCGYYNNAWDGGEPEDWGVCLNGITWQVLDGTLRLGYPIEHEGETVIESETGYVLPYSAYSIPWRGKLYSSVNTAPGVNYYAEGSGSCGESASWTLKNGTLTVSGTGEMYTYDSVSRPEWENAKDVIRSIVIEDGITSVGNMAFMNYPSVAGLKLPNSLETIGSNAFTGCDQLAKVEWGTGLKEVGIAAFSECPITEVVLPEGLTTLETQAFYGCPLTEVVLPSTLETFDAEVFRGCSKLESIEAAEGNELYASADGVLFTKDMKTLVLVPAAKPVNVYAVPSGVEKIGSYALMNSLIDEVVLSDTVKEIETNAIGFEGKKLIIPASVEDIAEYGVMLYGGDACVYVYEGSKAEEYFSTSEFYVNYKIIPDLTAVEAFKNQDGGVTVFFEGGSDMWLYVPVFAVCTSGGAFTELGELEYGRYESKAPADTVKLFIWDSFDTMVPLTEAKTVYSDAEIVK